MLVSLGLLSTAISCLELTLRANLLVGISLYPRKRLTTPKFCQIGKVADMSSRAAVQAESVFKANPALRETSIKVDGYYFQVTRNSKTGEITNSFIAMPPRIK